MKNQVISKNVPSLNHDLVKKAVLIRTVENKLLQLFSEGKLNGTVHTCVGQEFSALAFSGQLAKEDTVFSNHRCHGHYIAFTGDYEGLLAELMGKQSGVCGGIGGSQHLCKDNFYSNGIQGGIVPVAAGMALANKLKGTKQVVVVYIGDGMLGEGVVYEALNIISKWNLPILIVCENNYYAQSTPSKINLAGDILKRAEAFGIKTYHNDIWNTEELMQAASASIAEVREHQKPVFHLVETYRLNPHSKGDDDRDPDEINRYRDKDPINVFARENNPLFGKIQAETEQTVNVAVEEILKEPELDIRDYYQPLQEVACGPWEPLEEIDARQVELINVFFKEHMKNDRSIVFIGEDVWSPYGGAFKIARDLSDFFPDRVFSTPISEAAIIGISNGLAIKGFRPFTEIMFGDFITLGMDQIVNHAAKFHDMYNKQVKCPIVIRTPMGGRRGYGPTHSQTLDRFVTGIPNVKTIALNTLTNPQVIYQSIFNNEEHPVIVIENKLDYGSKIAKKRLPHYTYEKTSGDYPVVRIRPLQSAPNATLLCYGGMVATLLDCLEPLFINFEIKAEVIVLTKISPIDYAAILESVRETRRLYVIEEGTMTGGFGSEVAASVSERLYEQVRIKRIAALPVAIPSVRSLENQILPNVERILHSIAETL